ncbi:pyruvate dehydrogenase (acetyl-transferring) kinase, mitochondrial [Tanacetum coccineum]
MLRAFSMSLTGASSRWLRNKPSSSITTWEDLKTKFLSKYCPPARIAKKIEEINNFQLEPDETLYQAWERFKELLMKCPQHYLTEMQEVILFYNGLEVPTRQILDLKGAIPSKTVADAKAQLNNLGRKIKKVNEKVYVAQVGCEQCKGLHYTKDCPLKQEGKTLEEAYYTKFGAPFQGGGYRAAAPGFYQRNNANPSYQERRQSMEETLSKFMKKKGTYGLQFSKAYSYGASHIDNSIPRKEKDPGNRTVKYPKGIVVNVLVGIGKFVFPIDFIILDMPKDVKVPLILERPFLSTAHAKIDVFKQKITLRVGDEKIIFKSVKPTSSLIKRVYMLSLKERMELDLEARLMGETLVLNRSLDPLNGDYIELNDLNKPLELRRDQVDDLIPTIEEGEVIDAPMDDLVNSRNDKLDTGIDDYLSCCDYDKKIRIDCAHNLKFSCMIGFEFIHVNFFLILYVNVMSKKFYNFIMKDKLEYKGNNVLGALMNVPIFVGTFSVVTDFAVLEDMDAYRNEGMGNVIVDGPFLREIRIKA